MSQFRHFFRIALTFDQCSQHSSPAHSQNIGGHCREFDVRAFEDLLEAITLLGMILDETFSEGHDLCDPLASYAAGEWL